MKTIVISAVVRSAMMAPLNGSSGGHVLVVSRYRVTDDESVEFGGLAREALDALAGQPGFLRGSVGRNVDERDLWVLSTQWLNVGSYRRALSSYDVKTRAVPVMAHALNEPSAYEVLVARGDD
jgi:quinol monooxygenase YgiN